MQDFSKLTSTEFLEALHRGADGLWEPEAAIWLLEQHGFWLKDSRIRNYVLGGVDESGCQWAGFEINRIRDAIDEGVFGIEGRELAFLRISMSVYGDYRISLRYALDGFSEDDLKLVGDCLSRACGHFGEW